MASAQPMDPSLVGAVLSRRFRLTKPLGSGGMGSVFATDQTIDGRPVAIKILHAEFVSEPVVRERFAEEARTCLRLIHPNILRVFECGEADDGTPFIVMELLEGVPLSAYTQNGGRVPLPQAVSIAEGILAGLAAAHAQGIVHRDLKPENVFLARDNGAKFHVKLLDFGIAKVMDAAGGMGSKTRTGMLLGTPAYMSPEQVRDAKDVDARSDLWSVGVMVYEMLTGRTAFPAPTEYARLLAVLNDSPEPIERAEPRFAPLASFMRRALDKDRAARFQSALEMARALTAASASNDRVTARPSDASSRAVALSRLPDVPSLFAPSTLGVPAAPLQGGGAKNAPNTAVVPVALAPAKGPGGTLASPARVERVSEARAPQVVVQDAGGTLPSKDLPMLEPVSSGAPRIRRGVAPVVVVLLVALALVAGFLLGFAAARAG
jgi:eukaryotic-like serine/threonine-protein kinase